MQSTEHRQIGDIASQCARGKFDLKFTSDGYLKLTISGEGLDPVDLSYGDIVALGGDFYGLTDRPISVSPDSYSTFIQAHQTLVQADRRELGDIMRIMDKERDAVNRAVLAKQPPSAGLISLGDNLSYEWNAATGGRGGGPLNMSQYPGRYAKLAMNNLDHFGAEAKTSYIAGHAVACKTAPSNLAAALAMNAHADHFLTDLFAAGHIRTPRRLLNSHEWELCPSTLQTTVGALCSLAMHNEENQMGLVVENQRNQVWTSWGDSWILDPKAKQNYDIAVAAVVLSIQEVLTSATNPGTIPSNGALRLTPFVGGIYPPSGGPSIAPMLVNQDGPAERTGYLPFSRIPAPGLGGKNDYHYTTSFKWYSLIAETLGPNYLRSIGLSNSMFSSDAAADASQFTDGFDVDEDNEQSSTKAPLHFNFQ